MEFGEESKLTVFTPRQYKILSAFADRIIPRGGAFALGALDVGVAESVDRMLSNFDRTIQKGLRMLLLLIEYSTFFFTPLESPVASHGDRQFSNSLSASGGLRRTKALGEPRKTFGLLRGELLTGFTRKFRPFTRLSPEDQDSYLKSWEGSRFYLRRSPFLVLKMLCLSIFYSDERVEKDVGYEPACQDLTPNR